MNQSSSGKHMRDNGSASILITGSSGMLGTEFKHLLKERGHRVIALSKQDLDVTDRDSVLGSCDHGLDYIIHCAAKVNADYCEEHPDVCDRIQVGGTENVIELAKRTGARIVYPQSFLIFGECSEITEDTPPQPLNHYGRCKYRAEQMILDQIPGSLVVRMAGFFGGFSIDKNFVGRFAHHLHRKLKEGPFSEEVGDRLWQPTYTRDLAANTISLMERKSEGVYNMASHGEASFYDVAMLMVEALGLSDRICLSPVPAESMDRRERARRPRRARIVNTRLAREGVDLQRRWEDSLREYLGGKYFTEMFDEHFTRRV